MRVFKNIDVYLQVALMISMIFCILFGGGFIIIYITFALGIVQLASMVIHLAVFPRFKYSMPRKVYYVLLAIACLSAIYIAIRNNEGAWDELEALANFWAFTIGMAIYYLVICCRELIMVSKEEKAGMDKG